MKGSIVRIIVYCLALMVMAKFYLGRQIFNLNLSLLILFTSLLVFSDAESQYIKGEKDKQPFLSIGSLGWGFLVLLFSPLALVYFFARLQFIKVKKQIMPSMGIKIVTIVLMLLSFLGFLFLLSYSAEEGIKRFGMGYSYYTVFFLILFIFSVNILLLNEWARKSIILLILFDILFTLVSVIRDLQFSAIKTVLLDAAIIYFFTRPKVKEQFK